MSSKDTPMGKYSSGSTTRSEERIAVRDYERAIRLYRQLILNAAGTGRTEPPDGASS